MKKLLLFFLISFISFVSLPIFADENDGMTSSYRVDPDLENTAATTTATTSTDSYQMQPMQTTETAPTTQPSQTVLLSNELQRYQKMANEPWVTIPASKLKLKTNHPNVLLLRARLEQTGDLSPAVDTHTTLFDKPLVEAVKNFQDRHALKADGVVGNATLAELNITPQERIHQIEINIQRWAELSPQLSDRYILVIVPDYKLHLIENGHEVLTMKAIVGKPDWQTPDVTSRVTRVVFNPFWNVPTNIAINDIIPKAVDDPYYLDDMHIKVYVDHGNGNREVNRNEINWSRTQDSDTNPYIFRQEPGEDNSLGLVKFEFVNPYDVYLHDTPAKSLFSEENRDLSHGCIRLERPFDLVTYLMKDNVDWDSDRLQMVLESHKTTYVRVTKPIPIFITYLTVWVDEKGVVNYRHDVYNRDFPETTTAGLETPHDHLYQQAELTHRTLQ